MAEQATEMHAEELSAEEIAHFKAHGYVVVESVFSDEEVADMRAGLHADLAELGVDHDQILSGEAPPPSGVRGKGPASNIFYSEWKLRATLGDRVYGLSKSLLNHTFSSGCEPGFEHPLGASTDVLPFVDHVCYRLPDCIRAEGGLELHIDRNPRAPYAVRRFRPVQSFISLVDHYGGASGGLKLVPGFHTEYDDFFRAVATDSRSIKADPSHQHNAAEPPALSQNETFSGAAHKAAVEGAVMDSFDGEFFRLHGRQYTRLQRLAMPLSIPRGAIVFWDNRLPHQTCELLAGHDSREVIYFSYLPAVPLNVTYARTQWEHVTKGLRPPIYCSPTDRDQTCPRTALSSSICLARLCVVD
jgi:hypothetical protein